MSRYQIPTLLLPKHNRKQGELLIYESKLTRINDTTPTTQTVTEYTQPYTGQISSFSGVGVAQHDIPANVQSRCFWHFSPQREWLKDFDYLFVQFRINASDLDDSGSELTSDPASGFCNLHIMTTDWNPDTITWNAPPTLPTDTRLRMRNFISLDGVRYEGVQIVAPVRSDETFYGLAWSVDSVAAGFVKMSLTHAYFLRNVRI